MFTYGVIITNLLFHQQIIKISNIIGRPYRPKRCYCGWVPIYVTGWLAIWLYFCLVVGFRPRFHSGHLAPSEVSCLKRQTTLQNVQSRFRCPLNFSTSVMHAHCILGSSRKTHIDRDDVHRINVMQKSSKLELFYQIVKIHEFLKYARRSRASKALLLDDLSGAVSAY